MVQRCALCSSELSSKTEAMEFQVFSLRSRALTRVKNQMVQCFLDSALAAIWTYLVEVKSLRLLPRPKCLVQYQEKQLVSPSCFSPSKMKAIASLVLLAFLVAVVKADSCLQQPNSLGSGSACGNAGYVSCSATT